MRSLLAALMLLLVHHASAQDLDCEQPQTQQDMNACAYQAWQEADMDLNLAYGLAMSQAKSLDDYLDADQEPSAAMLRAAQRLWVPFRDQACEVESNLARGGTMQPLLRYSCMERLTRQRTEDLRFFGEAN